MYKEITLKNKNVLVIVLSVPFVHHTELRNFLIAPRNNVYFRMFKNSENAPIHLLYGFSIRSTCTSLARTNEDQSKSPHKIRG